MPQCTMTIFSSVVLCNLLPAKTVLDDQQSSQACYQLLLYTVTPRYQFAPQRRSHFRAELRCFHGSRFSLWQTHLSQRQLKSNCSSLLKLENLLAIPPLQPRFPSVSPTKTC